MAQNQEGASDEAARHNEDWFSRQRKIIPVYAHSTGSGAQLIDGDLKPVESYGACETCRDICRHCKLAPTNSSCGRRHESEIIESSRQGRPRIYRCELGLVFWVGPIYNNGNFAAALRGSGFRGANAKNAKDFCGESLGAEDFCRRVLALPQNDEERTASLAEMLLLCCEALSIGSANQHGTIRLRYEQQAALSAMVEKLREQNKEASEPLGYPIDKERQLVSALCQGDRKAAENSLNEILAVLVYDKKDRFHYIQLRALELAVLLSRVGTNSSSATDVENNTRYLDQVQDAKDIGELAGILHGIVANVAEQISSFTGLPHASAMRKAETFIKENLTRKISLGEIARIAGLSAPYFSTIFKEEMGENLSSYVNRQRVEKAARLLIETDTTLSEIAAICCFQDQSWFSKIFKTFTGVSPGKYRRQGGTAGALRSGYAATG
ncbi:MAG: helix-turn-helix domain-containing protein [Treponema sp.]|nr:helix-turn-helix domain-containing protein [Treponema sp.]